MGSMTQVNPIFQDVPLVNPDGTPTDYFLRWTQMVLNRIGGNNSVSVAQLAAASGYEEQIQGVNDAKTDNSSIITGAAAPNGYLVTDQDVRGRLQRAGTYAVNGLIDVDPSISLLMDARGEIVLQPGNNLPGTTSNIVGETYGSGAPASVIRAVRNAPTTSNPNPTASYYQKFQGFNIDFYGTTQTNTVHGIRVPCPDPAVNTHDPDPNFTVKKQYSAGDFDELELWYMPGYGILVEKENSRCHISSSRTLHCKLDGINLQCNDIVLDGHWGTGVNNGWGLNVNNAAGMLGVTGNLWATSGLRSTTCGAAFLNGRQHFAMSVCILNDWLRIDGGSSNTLAGSWTNSVFAPFASNFVSDGVCKDATPGGDMRLQSNIGVTDMQGVTLYGNTHCRTQVASFSTPYNTGGAGGVGTLGYAVGSTDGSNGTAPPYLHTTLGVGMTAVIEHVCSAPNVKPWCNTNPATASYGDPVPYRVSGNGQTVYLMQDSYLGLTRIGSRGVHSVLMLGAYERAFPSLVYAIELGDSSAPGGVPYRNAAQGMWEFQNPVQFQAGAWHYGAVSAGSTFSYAPTTQNEVIDLNLQGNTYTSGSITLPGGLNASQHLKINIRNGTCPSITWSTTTNTIDQSIVALPTSLNPSTSGGFSIDCWYDAGNDKLRVLSVSSAPVADIAASVSVAVNLTTGTVKNVTSIVLPAGSWDVFGAVQYTSSAGTSPTPSQCGCVMTTTSNTAYPTSDPTAYSGNTLNLGAVATSTDFLKVPLGPTRITVAAGATATVYLNAKCVFTGGANAVTAWGFLRAMPAN